MKITALENGSLRLAFDDADKAAGLPEDVREWNEDMIDFQVLERLLEPYSTNGGFTAVDSATQSMFVAMTSAPCIASEVAYVGGKAVLPPGAKVWWFPSYEARNPIDDLIKNGFVVFPLGFQVEDEITKDAPAGPLSISDLDRLWASLGDATVDNDGCLDRAWEHFPRGTKVEDIWHWFEAQSPDFSVAEKMGFAKTKSGSAPRG